MRIRREEKSIFYSYYRCFMSTDMDYLAINNYWYAKTDQPDWQDKEKWRVAFAAD